MDMKHSPGMIVMLNFLAALGQNGFGTEAIARACDTASREIDNFVISALECGVDIATGRVSIPDDIKVELASYINGKNGVVQ